MIRDGAASRDAEPGLECLALSCFPKVMALWIIATNRDAHFKTNQLYQRLLLQRLFVAMGNEVG